MRAIVAVTVMHVLVFVWCESVRVRVTVVLVWGLGEVWLQ